MKDPAFLFYSSDFLSGVVDLTMEERGQYITLLCLQHIKGTLTEKTIRLSVGSVSVDVLAKFVKNEDGEYKQLRLVEEIEKRQNFTESRRSNGKKGGRKPLAKPLALPNALPKNNHIENENENENINSNNNGVQNFEIWTDDVLKGNDPHIEPLLMRERITINAKQVKDHEAKCIRENIVFKNQQHFRKSLLGYLTTIRDKNKKTDTKFERKDIQI